MRDGAGLRDALHQLVAVPAAGLGHRHEVLVHVGHHHAGLIAHERHGKQRLEARRAAGDDADGARGRHGRHVAVAEQLHGTNAVPCLVARARGIGAPDALRPLGEGTALLGHQLALRLALDIEELHHAAAELNALGRVVADAELDERVGKTHHAQADAADLLAQRVNRGERILVDVNDVVEEVRAQPDVGAQRIPVHRPVVGVDADVHRAEVAHVVREQGLLAARVGGLVGAEVRHRVVLVGFVNEEDAGFAGAPRAHDHLVPDVLGLQRPHHVARGRMHQLVLAVGLERVHELARDAHGDVEVHHLRQVFLAGDEVEHVGVIHAQNAHVGATARAALLHRLG